MTFTVLPFVMHKLQHGSTRKVKKPLGLRWLRGITQSCNILEVEYWLWVEHPYGCTASRYPISPICWINGGLSLTYLNKKNESCLDYAWCRMGVTTARNSHSLHGAKSLCDFGVCDLGAAILGTDGRQAFQSDEVWNQNPETMNIGYIITNYNYQITRS